MSLPFARIPISPESPEAQAIWTTLNPLVPLADLIEISAGEAYQASAQRSGCVSSLALGFFVYFLSRARLYWQLSFHNAKHLNSSLAQSALHLRSFLHGNRSPSFVGRDFDVNVCDKELLLLNGFSRPMSRRVCVRTVHVMVQSMAPLSVGPHLLN